MKKRRCGGCIVIAAKEEPVLNIFQNQWVVINGLIVPVKDVDWILPPIAEHEKAEINNEAQCSEHHQVPPSVRADGRGIPGHRAFSLSLGHLTFHGADIVRKNVV